MSLKKLIIAVGVMATLVVLIIVLATVLPRKSGTYETITCTGCSSLGSILFSVRLEMIVVDESGEKEGGNGRNNALDYHTYHYKYKSLIRKAKTFDCKFRK